MITFTCCLIALIVGYFTYGKFIERIFGMDPKRADAGLYDARRCGLYPDAGMESLYDSVFEHRGTGADLWCHLRREVRDGFISVDCAG